MIKVFPNKLTGTEPECYALETSCTLLEFFQGRGLPEDAPLGSLPITVWEENGEQVLPCDWATYSLKPSTELEIYCEPKGADPFSITFALIFAAKAVLSALMPKIPGIPNSRSGSGDALDEASTKGNKVKVNDVVPECAGFNRRYPDYIVPPRRYYTEPRAQWIEMLLVIGPGEYQIFPATIKSGETPLLSLGADAEFRIYPPGVDLSSEPARKLWYNAPEVGQSSTGASGLELTASTALTLQATASAFQFNSTTVSIPAGAGSFPTDWVAGLLLAIGDPYVYTVADGTGTDGRDIISGGNVANLGFQVGDLIEIQGDNPGLYEVFSLSSTQLQLNYNGGAPAVGLAVGNMTMAIGYRGLRYRIVSYSAQNLIVERLKTDNTTDTTWPGWVSNTTNAGRVQLDSSNLEGGYRGPFYATPVGALATALEWDIAFPSGLVGLGAKGEYFTISGNHQFEWRDSALAGAWTVGQYSGSGNVLDALGFTFRTELPYPMRPEVRVKKLVIQQGGLRPDEVHDTTMWQALKAYIPASSPTRYEGVTTMAVRVRGADRIASQTESLVNLECTRLLETLNGFGQFSNARVPTRQISAWIRYIALSVGYTDADIDLVELQRLENIWTARGDFYDKIITDPSTVKESMIEALQVGFSELTLDRGVITPVRDDDRGAIPNHIYDPMNMLKALTREAVYQTPDDFDGVDVEYFDATTWANETVSCRLPGDLGTRVDKVTIEGVTDRNRAWRLGMRRRASQVYRNKTYSFNTELDALNSTYGDFVALGDAVIGYGQSAYMKRWIAVGDRYQITTSEKFDWSIGAGEHRLSIRRKDGTISGPYDVSRVSDKVVSISKAAFDADPRSFIPDLSGVTEPPFLRFGPADKWYYPALISEVSPTGTQGCKVTAVNYDPRVYAYDNGIADN